MQKTELNLHKVECTLHKTKFTLQKTKCSTPRLEINLQKTKCAMMLHLIRMQIYSSKLFRLPIVDRT